ncbi:unnamed protein product [Schistosoma mattheei]|uniref:BHLH domain-containing protein n=1 Tax=Schistosoma mattheei TaxID=31246 RepID=A0AA85BU93_9TREM|nr:unnamed protein product [Schistosoma mattheei]
MMTVSLDDSENNFTEKNRTTNIKKITSIAKSWGINGKMTINELGLLLVEKSSTYPVRKNLLEAFHLLYLLKASDETYPLVIIEKIITCLTLSLTHEYKLEALKILLLIAQEEKGLRNILRLQGCDATLNLLFKAEEVLKPYCLNLLIRISESLRGRIAILEYADSSQQLLLQLQKSKKFSNLILQLMTNLLGVPTARKMFSVPKFISYLSSKSDDSELNLRKQLLLWLVNLPSQNLVDHLASQYGLHDQNWNISTENNRIQNKTYNRVMVPTRMNPMREMNPSEIHRINQFQPNNNSFLYHETLNSNTSPALITGVSRPTLENSVLDSVNSPKTLYDNSLNYKPMLNQCLEHSANLLPYIYTNTSNGNMIYHRNTHQEVLLSPSIHHTNQSDLVDSSFSSLSPSLASKSECDDPMQTKIDSKRIHRTHDHHIRSNDNNLMNLSLSSSSSSTSSPSSTSFECARSFIRLRNARERERVRCVNAGYESLKRHLPLTILPDRRLAKVEILRGAINYINKLKELLEK